MDEQFNSSCTLSKALRLKVKRKNSDGQNTKPSLSVKEKCKLVNKTKTSNKQIKKSKERDRKRASKRTTAINTFANTGSVEKEASFQPLDDILQYDLNLVNENFESKCTKSSELPPTVPRKRLKDNVDAPPEGDINIEISDENSQQIETWSKIYDEVCSKRAKFDINNILNNAERENISEVSEETRQEKVNWDEIFEAVCLKQAQLVYNVLLNEPLTEREINSVFPNETIRKNFDARMVEIFETVCKKTVDPAQNKLAGYSSVEREINLEENKSGQTPTKSNIKRRSLEKIIDDAEQKCKHKRLHPSADKRYKEKRKQLHANSDKKRWNHHREHCSSDKRKSKELNVANFPRKRKINRLDYMKSIDRRKQTYKNISFKKFTKYTVGTSEIWKKLVDLDKRCPLLSKYYAVHQQVINRRHCVRKRPYDLISKVPKRNLTRIKAAYIRRGTEEYSRVKRRRYEMYIKNRLMGGYRKVFKVRGTKKSFYKAYTIVSKAIVTFMRRKSKVEMELIKMFDKLKRDVEENEGKVKSFERNSQGREDCLRELYGGKQEHCKTREACYFETNSVEYRRMNVLLASDKNEVISSSQEDQAPEEAIPDQQSIVPIKQPAVVEINNVDFPPTASKPKETEVRDCDDKCEIGKRWACKLHEGLRQLMKKATTVREIIETFMQFEHCKYCIPQHYPECEKEAECKDYIKLLRDAQPHFMHLRTVTRFIYHIRESVIWLIAVDDAIYLGDCFQLQRLMPDLFDKEKYVLDPSLATFKKTMDDDFRNNFGEIKAKFDAECNDFSKEICQVCSVRCKIIKAINSFEKLPANDETQKFLDFFAKKKITFPLKLCTHCHSDLFDKGWLPIHSELNNMGIDSLPEEISCLNLCEMQLIKMAKTFQTVIRLKPLSRRGGPWSENIQALKGLAVHLPLPLESTHKYISETLPSVEHLDILVDSVPSKQNVVWRSLINLDKVYAALRKLKEINDLYASVKISDRGADEEHNYVTHIHSVNDDGAPTLPEDEVRSMLKLANNDENVEMCNISVQSLDVNIANIDDLTRYKGEKIVDKPLQLKDPLTDMKCYPELFPNGQGGMYSDRKHKIGPPAYLEHRLNHSDSRFRRNIQWLFQELDRYEDRCIEQGMYGMMKTCSQRKLNASQLLQKFKEKDQELDANLSTLFSKLRGTKEYWRQVCGDLSAMDECWGPATFFLTISCAEYIWDDVAYFLHEMNKDLPGVANMKQSWLCATDPVSVSMQFKRRVDAFKRNILNNNKGPLGEVEHYFARLEYQARGAPHLHIKIWVKGAPVVGNASEEEIIQFIKKYITCAQPDKKYSPLMHKLVTQFQTHRCGTSCNRKMPVGRNKFVTRCRFGFPRPISEKFQMNTVAESVKSKRHRGHVTKLYNLQRGECERMINDYNPAILNIWQANMDIQFIGEESMVLNRYITSYITKPEKNATEELWDAIDHTKSLWVRLRTFARMNLKKREIGAYEATDKLLGNPFYYCSSAVIYINPAPHEFRRRRMISYVELEKLQKSEPESTHIYFNNMIEDYYPNRHDDLEGKSLYEIVTNYEYQKKKPSKEDKAFQLKNELGWFRKRLKQEPKVIKTPFYSTTTDEGKKRYFHALVMLFKPWRDENVDLLANLKGGPPHETFQEAFEACKDAFEPLKIFHLAKQRINRAQELAERIRAEADGEKETDEHMEEADLLQGQELMDADKQPPVTFKILSKEELDKKIDSLNSEQRNIFEEVMKRIRDQASGLSNEPVRLIVSGVAGVGKSFLIEVLTHAVRKEAYDRHLAYDTDRDPTAVIAPTGIAAFNIGGVTIHKYFKLNVQHGTDKNYFELGPDDVKTFRYIWNPLNLIILDEFSMLSNVNLTKMHLRLNQVCGVDENSFGGKNVILFGDFLQLPPVNAEFIFQRLIGQNARNALGSLCGYNLWEEFEYRELTINMRQREDLEYALMLNRFRLGSPTVKDIEQMQSRLISVLIKNKSRLNLDLQTTTVGTNSTPVDTNSTPVDVRKENLPCVGNSTSNGKSTSSENAEKKMERVREAVEYVAENLDKSTCLLPTHDKVNVYNAAMLKIKRIQVIEIDAQDYSRDSRKKQVATDVKKTSKSATGKLKTSDTAGLEEKLLVGVGARVMLRRNIDVSLGLVNGALGTVTNIYREHNKPTAIEIKFDKILQPYRLKKVTAEFQISKNIYVERKQFPICLAYAITIHKCQGMTLGKVVMDIGSSIFEKGMAYVALSRAQRLSDVYLIEFDPCKIQCNPLAIEEYVRLRGDKYPKLPEYNQLPDVYKRLRYVRQPETKAFAQHNKNSIPVEIPFKFLPLLNNNTNPNDRNACYANSVAQVILRLDHILNVVTREESPICMTISQLSNRDCSQKASTYELRKAVGGIFTGPDQQDAHEFWQKLFEKLPKKADDLFKFKKIYNPNCRRCKDKYIEPTEERYFEVTPGLVKGKDGKQKFRTLFPLVEHWLGCKHCESRKVRVEFGDQQQYLLVYFKIFDTKLDPETKREITFKIENREISEFNANRIQIHGKNFKTIAAIQYHGETFENGHYTCLVRSGDYWFHIDDTKVERPMKRFVSQLKDVYLLFFKRTE